MNDQLDTIEQQVRGTRNFDNPPLDKWHPELSGDIDIRIAADGSWYHEGSEIQREAIVRLFASILRREDDGEYYLVTPGEKWRIKVELHPLMVVAVDSDDSAPARLVATLNTGKTVLIGARHPLFLEPAVDHVAALELDHGLSALFTRAAWYRLVDMAQEQAGVPVIESDGHAYALARPDRA